MWIKILILLLYVFLAFIAGLFFNYRVLLYMEQQFLKSAFFGMTGVMLNVSLIGFAAFLGIEGIDSWWYIISLYIMLGIGAYFSTLWTKKFDNLLMKFFKKSSVSKK